MPDDGEANILVVTNAANGKVVGHKWAVWFSNGTESFNHILAAYQAQSPEVALETVTTSISENACASENFFCYVESLKEFQLLVREYSPKSLTIFRWSVALSV
jgi:hypothetical protein